MKSTAKLIDGEDVLRILSEHAPVGVCLMLDGEFSYVNSFFSSATGYRADELIGMDSLKIVVPEDKDTVSENTVKMLKGELLSPYQFRVICKDGSIIWVMATVKSVQYHGKPAILGNYMEVTERRKMVDALQESEERYRALFDRSLECIYLTDFEGNLLDANEKALELLGYEKQDIPHLNFASLLSQDQMPRAVAALQELKDTGTQKHVNEFRLRCKDGSFANVETIASVIYREGKPYAIQGTARDVTEHRLGEEALRQSEEKFRLLAENSVMGTFVLQDSKMVYVSPSFAKVFGYRPDEIINTMGPHEFIHPDDRDFMMQRLTDRYAGRVNDAYISFRGVKRDGSTLHIEASAALTEYGDKPAVMGTFIDVTERKQAEEALRKSEERYRQLAENAAEAILVVQDDAVKFINPKGTELSGYSAEELASKPFTSFIYPEDIYMVADRYVKRLRGEPVPDRYDFRIIRKDGDIRWGELNAVPIAWEDRPAVLCFMNDITERKQTEEALRESEERYRTILEETGDGYFETDLAGRFTFVNDAQACLLGYPREQIIGTDFRAFTPEERVTPVVKAYSRLYETGEPLRNFIDEVIRKDGSRGFAETSAFAIRDDKGETVGFRGVRRDITARKQMEEALRHSEENYRALFDSSVIGTVVLDAETGRVVMANQAAVKILEFGSQQEGIGRSPLDFVLPEDRETVRQVIGQDLFEQDVRRTAQSRAVTKSGREIWLTVTAARITHEGRLAALISFADITEQKLQNDKLMIADRLVSIGELAAGAAHELNNPLASIIGLSELLMEKNTPDYIRRDLAMIRDEARRAANVTSNLLTFARKHRPVKQFTQMNAIIEDVLKLRAYAHKSNSIKVERHLAPDLPEMLVDPFQMQQVFLNIVINAEYFMTQAHSRGTLVITTTRQNGGVKVSFADDGSGIPPEDLSRIFDPFFTRKEAGKGTGLGLSICHGIVTAHGGQIYAASQAGEGATISVELPINGSNRAEVML